MKVVRISAIWCGSCLAMKRKWSDIEKVYSIEAVDLDYDLDIDEVNKYNIGDKLPVSIFFKDNVEVARLIGEKNKDDIINIINKYK